MLGVRKAVRTAVRKQLYRPLSASQTQLQDRKVGASPVVRGWCEQLLAGKQELSGCVSAGSGPGSV